MKPLKERIADREQRRKDADEQVALSAKALLTVQADVLRDLERQGEEEAAQREVALRETRKRVAAPNKKPVVDPFVKKVADAQAAKKSKK